MGSRVSPSSTPLGSGRSFMTSGSRQKSCFPPILKLPPRPACGRSKPGKKTLDDQSFDYQDIQIPEGGSGDQSRQFRGEEGVVVYPSQQRRDYPGESPAAKAPDLSISDALDRWYQIHVNRPDKSEGYRSNVFRVIVAWLNILPPKNVRQLNSLDIEGLRATRDNGKRSAYWLNTERSYLRCFWNWLLSHNLVEHDPVTPGWPHTAKSKLTPKRKYRDITVEEEAAICAVLLDDSKWKKLKRKKREAIVKCIHLGIGTAIRKSAIWGLLRRHLQDGVLRVPAELDKCRKEREYPLPEILLRLLGESDKPNEPLIPNLPHKKNVNEYLKKAAAIVGMNSEDVYFHQLRRTFVGRAFSAGVPLPEVMQVGGWASVDVILQHYYSGISQDKKRGILERISG